MVQIVHAEIDNSQFLVGKVMLLLVLLHLAQDALGIATPTCKSVYVTQHRAAVTWVLRVDLFVDLRRLIESAQRNVNNAVHVLAASEIWLIRRQPIQTRVGLLKLARLILCAAEIHDRGAREWLKVHRCLAFSQRLVKSPGHCEQVRIIRTSWLIVLIDSQSPLKFFFRTFPIPICLQEHYAVGVM